MSKSRDSFVRLAEGRTTKVLKALDLLSNLSNRSNYTYDEDDVRKIFLAINKSVREAQSRFDAGLRGRRKSEFKL